MNPTNQFIVTTLIPLNIYGYDLSITNSTISMFITLTISFITLKFFTHTTTMRFIHTFFENTITEYAGPTSKTYTPLIIAIFLTVFLGSFIGLIPGIYTFTSQLILTLYLAIIAFLSVIIIGFKEKGLSFLKIFVPSGLPLPITLFIIPIEIISFFIRPISLCLRLCINMIAGHMLLKIILSFSGMINLEHLSTLPTILFTILKPLIAIIPTTTLILFEILVALIQAYIFTVLTCIYLSDSTSTTSH